MKISFIVPVYNGERYLRACLDSILGQSVQNIEVVAVNNGSIDNSQAVLTDYAAKDTRVRVLNTPNAGGVSAARNLGFREARGDYVWFLDCDDVLLEGSAEKMLHRAEETGADLVAAGFRYLYDENGQTRAVDLPMADNLLEGTTLANAMHFTALGGCKLWRAQMLRENHLHLLSLFPNSTIHALSTAMKPKSCFQNTMTVGAQVSSIPKASLLPTSSSRW